MNIINTSRVAFLLVAGASLAACQQGEAKKETGAAAQESQTASTQKTIKDEDKISYALGSKMAENMKKNVERFKSVQMNMDAMAQGFTDTLKSGPAMSAAEIDAKLTEFQQLMVAAQKQEQALQAQKMKEQSKDIIAAGEKFLAENAKKEGVKVTESGLQYEVITAAPEGAAKPKATDVVRVHYVGTLTDGTEFDSSVSRGKPLEFGLNRVIKGWTEGVQLMGVGSKYKFTIPYPLGYGEHGSPPKIPGFSVLQFEVELLAINPKEPVK